MNIEHAGIAPFLYFTYREQNRTLQDIAMWTGDSVAVTGSAEPQRVDAIDVTQGALPILGVTPFLGRLFSQADDSPGAPQTIDLELRLLAIALRRRAVGRGAKIVADGQPREIIGVLPEQFRFLDQKPALFLPMQHDRGKTFLGNFSFQSFARLKPGVTMAQARRRCRTSHPGGAGRLSAVSRIQHQNVL